MSLGNLVIRVLLVPLFLGISACTTLGPDFETPEADLGDSNDWEQQKQIPVTADEDSLADWWSVFNDPVLNELVNTAYEQNLPLQVAGLRIFEARAQLGIAIGQQYPQNQQVNGALTTVGLSDNSPNLNKNFTDTTFNEASIGFDAAWEMDFWGRYRRGVESASANLGATVADYDNALVSLTSEVARVYINLRTLQERLAIARANAETQRRGFKISDVRFRNGAVSELDPAQAKTLLKATESLIPVFISQISQSRHALSILLGMAPGDLTKILGSSGDKIPEPPESLALGVRADLLRRRPDIRRAELEAAAQSARIGVADSDLYPRIALIGSIGLLTSDTNNSDLSDVFNSDSVGYSFGPSVTWNIFNYGRIKNQVRVQDARLEELLVSYQNQVINAVREVEDGISSYAGSRQQVGYLKEGVQAASRAVDLALIQYREGAVDYQRVLDTQRSQLEIQDSYTSARGNVVLSLVATYKALGGGWKIRSGKQFVPVDIQKKMEERTDWGRLMEASEVPGELPEPPPTGTEQPLFNKPSW